MFCLVSTIPLPFFRSVATLAVAGENGNAGNQAFVWLHVVSLSVNYSTQITSASNRRDLATI